MAVPKKRTSKAKKNSRKVSSPIKERASPVVNIKFVYFSGYKIRLG